MRAYISSYDGRSWLKFSHNVKTASLALRARLASRSGSALSPRSALAPLALRATRSPRLALRARLGSLAPPFWGNLGGKRKLCPQISPPPRGSGGHFQCQTMPDGGPYLSSKPQGCAPLPRFLGDFSPKFRIFSRGKRQIPVAKCPGVFSLSNFACRFRFEGTSF